jgi:hypothetical protein
MQDPLPSPFLPPHALTRDVKGHALCHAEQLLPRRHLIHQPQRLGSLLHTTGASQVRQNQLISCLLMKWALGII